MGKGIWQGVKSPIPDAQGISHPFHTPCSDESRQRCEMRTNPFHTHFTPPPRTFDGKKYYGANNVAIAQELLDEISALIRTVDSQFLGTAIDTLRTIRDAFVLHCKQNADRV